MGNSASTQSAFVELGQNSGANKLAERNVASMTLDRDKGY